jgi:hypothetical protein
MECFLSGQKEGRNPVPEAQRPVARPKTVTAQNSANSTKQSYAKEEKPYPEL